MESALSPSDILNRASSNSAAKPVPATDPRIANATQHVWRFAIILAQLAALLFVFREFQLEEAAFLRLAALMFFGFAVQYWLPFAYRRRFVLGLSLASAYVLMEPLTATLLLGTGLGIFALLASPIPFAARMGGLAALALVLMYGRATLNWGIPYQFWPIFGAIFMFRLLIYIYDLRYSKDRPSLFEYLNYFFLLPNYYFLLFPVVDYQTFKASYYRRDINDVAQRGVAWIARGAVQLLLYRLIYHLKPPTNAPDEITSFAALATTMVMTYLLYLRVSGQFHIIVGLMHLFGYDLPETHRRYLLAHSLTDFWRRINIYWKDFMVKLVYFPLYFRLRRQGDTRAQIVATGAVFVVTWLLHSYQWFWLRGEWLFTWPDTLFWGILGGLVIVNVLVEARRGQKRQVTGWQGRLQRGLQIAGTFSLITTLWFLWNASSLGEWLDVMTWWRIG
jgi:D-alanyl-lipoteichoic acid acyltransferase DltB (MBOAT superfamily)